MILEIQHETRFEYPGPVSEAFSEMRMEPLSDVDQSCRSFYFRLNPHAELHRYQDGLGNRVHHFNFLGRHQEISILAASVVETHPHHVDLSISTAIYPIAEETLPLETMDFISFRGPVRETPLLHPIIDAVKLPPGSRVVDLISNISHYIKQRFEYAKDVTSANSPIDDVLSGGKGVCQDFAHLMIALLRAHGVPARYVSGYIHRPNRESQSHAWCEAWVPDLGWVGIDPTNNCFTNDHFVKVAFGRDFSDVPPNKGIYRGNETQTISVRVETRALERQPPLSWQEQLPPLQVPLKAFVPINSTSLSLLESEQQQQQQQQQQSRLRSALSSAHDQQDQQQQQQQQQQQ